MIGGTLTAKSSSFNYNNAETAAGIFATQQAFLDLEDCIFEQNAAEADAGVIYASNSKIHANNLYFKSNSAAQDGAAIFLSGTQTVVRVDNSTFESNLAETGNGGALFCENGAKFQATNTSFEFNKVSTYAANLTE